MKRIGVESWTQFTGSGLRDYHVVTLDGEDLFEFSAWWVRLPIISVICGAFLWLVSVTA